MVLFLVVHGNRTCTRTPHAMHTSYGIAADSRTAIHLLPCCHSAVHAHVEFNKWFRFVRCKCPGLTGPAADGRLIHYTVSRDGGIRCRV